MIEILGYIFAAILAVIALWIVYHVIRGAVFGASLMRWRLKGVSWTKIRSVKGWPKELISLYLNCWLECMFYDGSTTYRRGDDTWSGFGTGR